MKAKFIILLLTATICGCDSLTQKVDGDCAVLIFDITDSLQSVQEFNVDDLKPYFSISTDPNKSAQCKVAIASEKMYNASTRISAIGESALLANVIERNHLRDNFWAQISGATNKINTLKPGQSNSYIVYAIAESIKDLKACQTRELRRILIFSDMNENSSFSVFNKETFNIIKHHPDSAMEILDREYPISNAAGIELIIVHLPLTPAADKMFKIVADGFFRRYYEGKGMHVIIKTNL